MFSGYCQEVDEKEELLDPGSFQELTVSSTSGANEANSDSERDDDKEKEEFAEDQEDTFGEEADNMSERIVCDKFVYGRDASTLGQRWEDWLEKFDLFLQANSIANEEKKKASLLLLMGNEAFDIYKVKRKSTKDDKYEEIKAFMTAHIQVKRCEYTEVMGFRRALRQEGESVNDYAMRLRTAATHCKFSDIDKEIERQFVAGCKMHELERKVCTSTEDITLQKVLDWATAFESCEANVNGLHATAERIHEISEDTVSHLKDQRNISQASKARQGGGYHPSRGDGAPRGESRGQGQSGARCFSCNRSKHADMSQCPAKGRECRICGKVNHFAVTCRSKPQTSQSASKSASQNGGPRKQVSFQVDGSKVRHIEGSSKLGEVVLSAEEYAEFARYKEYTEWLGALKGSDTVRRIHSGPRSEFRLGDNVLECLVDTGSPINVIDEVTYEGLRNRPRLEVCAKKYYGYTAKTPLEIRGQFVADVEFRGVKTQAGFIVIIGQEESLLSYRTAMALGIVKVLEQSKVYAVAGGSVTGRHREQQ